MKRTYKDLSNDQLADLHRALLGLSPDTIVHRVSRGSETLEEHPFVHTISHNQNVLIVWFINDNTIVVSGNAPAVDYLAAADKARQFGIGLSDDDLLDRNRLADDIEKTGRDMADWAQGVSDSFDRIRNAASNQP